MSRKKLIPDQDVFLALRQLWAAGGNKAVSFGTVARATGLAPATLAQRFGSRDSMIQQALTSAWTDLEAKTGLAESDAPLNSKGAALFLKILGEDTALCDVAALTADFRNPSLRAMAQSWRAQVENALALRLGGGTEGKEIAAIVFAAWQGQMQWQTSGGKGFKLKDLLKRLSG